MDFGELHYQQLENKQNEKRSGNGETTIKDRKDTGSGGEIKLNHSQERSEV